MNASSRLAVVASVPVLLCLLGDAGRAEAVGARAPVVPAATRAVSPPVVTLECPDCGDSDPCTADSCDTLTGFCRHEPLSCDDGDPCTLDRCDPWESSPGCQNIRLPDGAACSAAGVCVKAGVCGAGACRALPEPAGTSCDDALACTEGDVCDGAGTCAPGRPSSEGTPCSDGDPCTEDDVCGFGDLGEPVCRGAARSCDDGDPCTDDSCGPDRSCLHAEVVCEDGNRCTTDTCEGRTGACVHTPANAGAWCDGSDRCIPSSCVAGNCVGTGTPGAMCDDHIDCTLDVCNPASPLLCDHIPDSTRCPQDGPCDAYVCDPQEFGCTGTGSCMYDQCTTGQCSSRGYCTPISGTPGAPCDDGNACTINDTCGAGCQGTPISCDDGIACTLDLCDPVTGCAHVLDPMACDDGNPCTRDACDADGATCAHTPLHGDACDDGNACTFGTVCVDGACGGDPVGCDDQNACTDDACDPALGCRHAAVVCPSDGNACTAEICNSVHGCASHPLGGTACDGDGNDCTADVCVEGACTHPPGNEGLACGGAGDPCGVSVCRSGSCAAPTGCDDGILCTRDVCLGGGGCAHLAQPPDFECEDGNPCTEADFCAVTPEGDAVCLGTVPVSRPETCGVGACERMMDTCAGGVPRACVPGDPADEVCNGFDDDCDGATDENRIQAVCWLRPAILYDPPMRTDFALLCRFRDRCAGNVDLPPGGIDEAAAFITRADRLADPDDNVSRPDPLTLACPDPQIGTAFERGIVEQTPARVLGGSTVTLNFIAPHDGDCATLDGDKSALLDRLAGTANGLVVVCASGWYEGSPWEGCAIGLLRRAAATLE